MADEIVVAERHQRCRKQVQRKDDLQPQAERIRGGAARMSIHLPFDYTGLPRAQTQKRAAPGGYTCAMFPVSDVIPSRTTPFVTVGLIVAERAGVPLRASAVAAASCSCSCSCSAWCPRISRGRSLVTSMFLHEGWLHLLGNMLYLWIFGDNVEDQPRPLRLPDLLSVLRCARPRSARWPSAPGSTIPMIGASGAIAGVMGAYFVLYPHSRVLTVVFLLFFMDMIEIPAIFFLGIWFVKELFSGVGSLGARSLSGGRRVLGARRRLRRRRRSSGLFWRVREPPRRSYWV